MSHVESPFIRLGVGLAATGLAVTALTSCTGNESSPPSPTASSSSSPRPEVVKNPTCLEPTASEDGAQQQACVELRTSTISVVDFGPLGSGFKYKAAVVAKLAMEDIDKGTEGYIDPKIRVIQATPVAEAALKKVEKKTDIGVCVDTNKPEDWMSAVAKRTMAPELRGSTMIEAIGSLSCPTSDADGTVGGIALPGTNIADIYSDSEPGLIEIGNQTPDEVLAGREAHETLHLYGLGHDGDEYCKDANLENPQPTPVVDLDVFLTKACDYEEYGSIGDIMSNAISPPNSKSDDLLDDMQRDYLRYTSPDEDIKFSGVPILGENTPQVIYKSAAEGSTYTSVGIPTTTEMATEFPAFTNVYFRLGNTFLNKKHPDVPSIQVSVATAPIADQFTEMDISSFPFPKDGMTFKVGTATITAKPQGTGVAFTLVSY